MIAESSNLEAAVIGVAQFLSRDQRPLKTFPLPLRQSANQSAPGHASLSPFRP